MTGTRWPRDGEGRGSAGETGRVPDPTYAALLQQRVAHAERQSADLVTTVEAVRAARRLSVADDEHDPEGSTVSLDQAREVALLTRVEHTLAELRAAQCRLADDSYGRCQGCGQPIPAGRLRARPEARFCVPCSAPAGRRRHSGSGLGPAPDPGVRAPTAEKRPSGS